MQRIVIYKGRTITVPVSIGFDVSQDEFASQIRLDKSRTSELIATWDISYLTDGVDGEIVLRLDDSVTETITRATGWMDIKRISGGEALQVNNEPIEVLIKRTITE